MLTSTKEANTTIHERRRIQRSRDWQDFVILKEVALSRDGRKWDVFAARGTLLIGPGMSYPLQLLVGAKLRMM